MLRTYHFLLSQFYVTLLNILITADIPSPMIRGIQPRRKPAGIRPIKKGKNDS